MLTYMLYVTLMYNVNVKLTYHWLISYRNEPWFSIGNEIISFRIILVRNFGIRSPISLINLVF